MKVSSRVDYAVSCAVRLTDKYQAKRPVSVAYISDKEKIEPDYVEQILISMKRSGILKSIRGVSGGYVLARPPHRITAKDIILSIEKNILEPVCFRQKGRRKKCVHLDDCKLRFLWEGLREEMEDYLKLYTLKDLLAARKREKNW